MRKLAVMAVAGVAALGGGGAVLMGSAALTKNAFAQQPNAGNLEKLSEFKSTGTPIDIPQIPQGGSKAEAIKKNLARIKLPAGFKIGLYAVVPDARHMAVGPQGVVTFVGTRKNKVWAVTDRDKDRVAEIGRASCRERVKMSEGEGVG